MDVLYQFSWNWPSGCTEEVIKVKKYKWKLVNITNEHNVIGKDQQH